MMSRKAQVSGLVRAASAANAARSIVGTALAAILLISTTALADTMDDEIDYLIGSIGHNGCTFIRNGRHYSTRDARAYLRSKRRLNAHIIDSTEEFIDKIASTSVTTGKPYLIDCRGEERQPAGKWFAALLADYRNLQP